MYVDRSRGWVERQRAGLTRIFPCETGEEGRSLLQRGRSPLRTIGSPAIRGINMLDTSPARGNAFVTPGNILMPFSLSILSILFLLVFPCSSTLFFLMSFDKELSFSPSFAFASRLKFQYTECLRTYCVYIFT